MTSFKEVSDKNQLSFSKILTHKAHKLWRHFNETFWFVAFGSQSRANGTSLQSLRCEANLCQKVPLSTVALHQMASNNDGGVSSLPGFRINEAGPNRPTLLGPDHYHMNRRGRLIFDLLPAQMEEMSLTVLAPFRELCFALWCLLGSVVNNFS